MVPPPRTKCRDCKKNLGKAKASGWSLMKELIGRSCPDGKPYDIEHDWFCASCRNKIKPSGKTIKYPYAGVSTNSIQFRGDDVDPTNYENENENAETYEPMNDEPMLAENHQSSMLGQDFEQSTEESAYDSQAAMQHVELVYSCSEQSNATSQQQPRYPIKRSGRENHIVRPAKSAKTFLSNTKSVPYTERRCCVCNRTEERIRVPDEIRLQFWKSTLIWIPSKNRCCPHHYENGSFTEEAKSLLEAQTTLGAYLTHEEVELWILQLTSDHHRQRIDVDFDPLTDMDYELLFGVNKASFDDLFGFIREKIRASVHRTPRNALAIFLVKIRLGISQRMLGFLFGMPQRKISKTIIRVGKVLEEKFVTQNLGFRHIERNELVAAHYSDFVKRLYNVPEGCLVLILDGTYLYCQKSADHRVQRKTYSMQKSRNLIKVMMVVTPTGYIVDCFGCYFSDGHHNDAKILLNMFEGPAGIDDFVEEGDIFVLDRGFRDAREFLEKKKITVLMPSFLEKGQKQFTTEESNQSRQVTLVRWVVESANGRLKNMFKFFDTVIPTSYFNIKCQEKLNRLLRICCSIINKYCPPIFQDTEKHMEILREVEKRRDKPNALYDEVKKNTSMMVRQKKCWKNVTADTFPEFPQFSLPELHKTTLGKFNIKNARGYTDEKLNAEREYRFQVHRTIPGLLRVRMHSKFRSAGSDFLWIRYSTTEGDDKIQGHYCQCMGGAKSVGCCSHIASVIWYLGYRRHQPASYRPRSFGEDIIEIVTRSVKSAKDIGESDASGNEEEIEDEQGREDDESEYDSDCFYVNVS